MSCFLACFGASKRKNRRKNGRKLPPGNPNGGDHQCKIVSAVNVADKEDESEKRVGLVADSPVKPPGEPLSLIDQAKPEEQFSSGTQNKVTFDSNIKEYNHIYVAEAPGNVLDNEIGVNQNSIELAKSESLSESGSTVSSLGLYPLNHRYQNCRESDDDEEELDDLVSDLDEDDDLEPGTKSPATHEVNDRHHETVSNSLTPEMKITSPRVNQSVRDRAGYVDSVMNPIQNKSQWRRAKTKGTFPLKEKENFGIASTFEPESKNEVVVDASLSNWLVSNQKTPINKGTPVDLEPISSVSSMSSHGSNSVISQSPEEKPLVGTGGVHWNDRTPTEDSASISTSSFKGIPNTTSKYREVQK